MYSVVLMAALTAGSAPVGFGHGCGGCHGCHGWGYATYSGNFCTGCSGCYGCSGCTGCSGCYGCSGYNYMVGHGYQSSFSVYAPIACTGVFGCTGCYGCYGGWSCYGVPLAGHGYWNECAPVAPVTPTPKANVAPKVEQVPLPKEEKKKKTELSEETQARLSIDVPDDAKVYLDGTLMKTPVAKHVFLTPPLVPGRTYFYDLRVEVIREGQEVAATQRILVRAGQTALATFPNLREGANAVATPASFSEP